MIPPPAPASPLIKASDIVTANSPANKLKRITHRRTRRKIVVERERERRVYVCMYVSNNLGCSERVLKC